MSHFHSSVKLLNGIHKEYDCGNWDTQHLNGETIWKLYDNDDHWIHDPQFGDCPFRISETKTGWKYFFFSGLEVLSDITYEQQ